MAVSVSKGAAGITVTEMPTAIDKVDVAGVLAGVLLAAAPEMLQDLRSQWPKATGKSAAAWTTAVTRTADSATLTLDNGLDYTAYIHVKGSGELVFDKITKSFESKYGPILMDRATVALTTAYEEAARA